MRVCAVDIGTNSVRTIVADVRAPCLVEVVRYDGRITRLGEGLGESNSLKAQAIERTVRVVKDHVEHGRRMGPRAFKLVATSAARKAGNGAHLLQAIHDAAAVAAEIVTGEREAQLVLAGVRAGGMLGETPALVVDVGGGSTELIACAGAGPPDIQSFNIGAVNLTEQFLKTDPPTQEEMNAASSAAGQLPGSALGDCKAIDLVGLGGTITTMAAMLQQLHEYDPAAVHGTRLTLDETRDLLSRAASLPLDERKQLPGLSAARADIIVAGMILVQAVFAAANHDEMRVCTTGILHGVALAAAHE